MQRQLFSTKVERDSTLPQSKLEGPYSRADNLKHIRCAVFCSSKDYGAAVEAHRGELNNLAKLAQLDRASVS